MIVSVPIIAGLATYERRVIRAMVAPPEFVSSITPLSLTGSTWRKHGMIGVIPIIIGDIPKTRDVQLQGISQLYGI